MTGKTMKTWETPSFVAIKMDAEIGSYQDDFDPAREEVPFAERGDGDEADAG